MGLHRPEAVIEGREKLGAQLGGDDSPSPPVGRIGAPLYQAGRFEVIEKVGHDRPVDSQMLGQGELARNGALSGGGKDLVAPWAAGKVGHRGVCGRGIRTKDHAQTPAEVVRQRGAAAGGSPDFVTAIRGVIHQPIIAEKALFPRSSVDTMICFAYS